MAGAAADIPPQTGTGTGHISIPNDCYIWDRTGIAFLNILGVVNWLLETNSIITIAETGEILVYYAGRYERLGEQILKRILELAFGNTLNTDNRPILNCHKIKEILSKVSNRTLVHANKINTGLDPDTNEPLLNLENGVLNLETRELLSHSTKYLFTCMLPVVYDPNAKCPTYIAWRDEVLNSVYHWATDEMMGAILWPDYRIQKAFMLLGPPRSGKGTLIRILEALVGHDSCSHVALQELATNRFKVFNLFGKMLNTFGDLPETAMVDVGYFKALTDEDTVEGEAKFKAALNFYNRAKLVFSANRLPRLKTDDIAFYNRWVIIPFEKVLLGQRGHITKGQVNHSGRVERDIESGIGWPG